MDISITSLPEINENKIYTNKDIYYLFYNYENKSMTFKQEDIFPWNDIYLLINLTVNWLEKFYMNNDSYRMLNFSMKLL